MPETSTRETARYEFAVPMIVELSNGLFRRPDMIDAIMVDMSQQGAAVLMPVDARMKVNKRYRVRLDDHDGIVKIGSVVPHDEGRLRVGMQFERLGLELQELIADAVQDAQSRASRLTS